METATLTRTGRAAIVKALKSRPLHLAWGTGDADWDEDAAVLPPLIDRQSLFNEIGRRTASVVAFAVPDEDGGIIVPTGEVNGELTLVKYSITDDPSPFLYVQTHFWFDDAPNQKIRELGLFMDTEVDPACPPGQRYFLPSEITNPGLLLAAQIVKPGIDRSPAIRQAIEFVLPI